MKKTVVLIRINSIDMMINPPLGLLYVGDALKKAGYNVAVFHICEDDINNYIEDILKLNPTWIGFSVNTGWSINSAIELSKKLKEKTSAPIVWGNAHPSLMPDQCLKNDAIDYVVIGEGEITSVELSDAIVSGKKKFSSINGIGYKDSKGKIIITKARELIKDLDQYKMDWTLLDPEKYVIEIPKFGMKRAFQFITSRGCPHNCGFCYNQRFSKRLWRAHSEKYVVNAILELKIKLKLDGIRFWDDNFFTNKKRAFSILNRVDLPYTAEIRVDYFDDEFTEKLAQSRCRMVLLGLESGSNRILDFIKKGTRVKDNYYAIDQLNKYPEIAIHPSVIVGFPTEKESEYKETLLMFANMIITKPNFWFIRVGLYIPFPGCFLFDMALESKKLELPEHLNEWDDLVWDTSKKKSFICVDWIKNKYELKKDEEYLMLLNRIVKTKLPIQFLAVLIKKRIKSRFYKLEIEKYLCNGLFNVLKVFKIFQL